MTAFVTLVALDVRELWMSFRLLLVLSVLLGSALAVVVGAAVAPTLPGPAVYGVALGISSAIGAGAAAHIVASDLRRGPAAWLTVRAVPRSSLLLAWLSAFVAPVVGGMLVSAVIAWLTLATAPAVASVAAGFSFAILAAAGGWFVAVALGVAAGTLLPPWRAALLAGAAALVVAVLPLALPTSPALPGGGFALLASIVTVERPIATALQATGEALVAIAVLTAVAAAFLQRVDL